LAFCFSTLSWAGTLVMERELKLKYSLNVMGCRPEAYWVGTFAFDYIMFFINFLLFIALIYAVNLEVVISFFP
jgi:ATP-binding cassette, subfamily A (ABC1), member 3